MNTRARLRVSVRSLALAGMTVIAFGNFAADAKTFRWASAGDILTMDPHSQNEGLNNPMNGHVYEPLITRDEKMALEPCLAVSWQQLDPSTVRFKLREKVTFHNAEAFTADDVVFSIQRAMEKTSDYKAYIQGIKEVRKVDNLTVDIISTGPNPTLLDQLTQLRMMNKAWATKYNVLRPTDFKQRGILGGAQRQWHRRLHFENPRARCENSIRG